MAAQVGHHHRIAQLLQRRGQLLELVPFLFPAVQQDDRDGLFPLAAGIVRHGQLDAVARLKGNVLRLGSLLFLGRRRPRRPQAASPAAPASPTPQATTANSRLRATPGKILIALSLSLAPRPLSYRKSPLAQRQHSGGPACEKGCRGAKSSICPPRRRRRSHGRPSYITSRCRSFCRPWRPVSSSIGFGRCRPACGGYGGHRLVALGPGDVSRRVRRRGIALQPGSPGSLIIALFLAAVAAAAATWHHCRWHLVACRDLGLYAHGRPQPVCIEAIAVQGPERCRPGAWTPCGRLLAATGFAVDARSGRAVQRHRLATAGGPGRAIGSGRAAENRGRRPPAMFRPPLGARRPTQPPGPPTRPPACGPTASIAGSGPKTPSACRWSGRAAAFGRPPPSMACGPAAIGSWKTI